MYEWIIEEATTVLSLPAFVIPLLLALGTIGGAIISFLFRRMIYIFLAGQQREEREWAIGEVSFVGKSGRSGFIDTRSGRKNVRFEKDALQSGEAPQIGQRVRFLANWKAIQPKAILVQML